MFPFFPWNLSTGDHAAATGFPVAGVAFAPVIFGFSPHVDIDNMVMANGIDDVNIYLQRQHREDMAAQRTAQRPKEPREAEASSPYHHGSLRAALLGAAEHILTRDGLQGLTLRAAAREAGVSHAAPKNHFGDIKGLLSDLAAVGFERLEQAMRARIRPDDDPRERRIAIGQGYVAFARANPGLFLLMFRGERLDFTRPALRAAADAAFGMLAGTVSEGSDKAQKGTVTLERAARIVRAWSTVHGLAMLLIDGRLRTLIGMLPNGTDDTALIAEVLDLRAPR